MVNDLRGALYAHLQRLSLAFHSRQRVGDLMYRITADSFAVQTMIMNGAVADPVGGGAARPACCSCCSRSIRRLTLALADRRAGAVRADRGVQPQDRRGRHRGARPPRAGSIPWCNGRCRRSRSCRPSPRKRKNIAASWARAAQSLRATLRLYSWQTLYSGAVNAVIAGGTALVVYAGAHAVMSRRADRRAADRLHLLSRAALRPDQPDHPELGADRRRAGRAPRRVFEVLDTEPDLEGRQPQLSAAGRARRGRVARVSLPLSRRRRRC